MISDDVLVSFFVVLAAVVRHVAAVPATPS